jgi:hypothetical protein
MKERAWIEAIVERVVGQVLDSHAGQLRTEIVRRVMEEIAAETATGEATAAEPSSQNGASASSAADLARAVAEIQMGASQREILRALLDASARYAARVALFVVKGSHATGWQARGFANNDAVKDFALDESAPAVVRAIGCAIADRAATSAPVADLDARFLHELGTPASGEGRIFPLILKDKVAALVYADSGTGAAGVLDPGSLELLVMATSAWLEVNSLRKQAHKESFAGNAAPAYNDPFAVHAPGHAMAAAASASMPALEVAAMGAEAVTSEAQNAAVESHVENPADVQTEVQAAVPTEVQSAVAEAGPALAEPLPLGHVETVATPETPPASAVLSDIAPGDQDVHRKAQRFARLLVDEIKLYNQAKVAEGRKNKDLYDRLKEAIEKNRATYQKRYGNTVADSGNYFQHEIMRSLAEDDLSIMGANFPQ